jgi:Short C-terminal domain
MPSSKHLRLVPPPIDSTPASTRLRAKHLDVLDHLRKLTALRAAGVLTEDEYEVKRAELRAMLDDLL